MSGKPPPQYRRKGQSWTHKIVKLLAGHDSVSFIHTEVVESNGPRGRTRVAWLNEDREGSELVPPVENDFDFTPDKDPKPREQWPPPGAREEEITVEAGRFGCIQIETEKSGNKTTIWMSKEYPGLMVRSVTQGKLKATIELVELVI